MLETQGADVAELFLAVPFGPEAKIQAPQIKIPTNLLWSSEPFYFYSLSVSLSFSLFPPNILNPFLKFEGFSTL